MKKHAGNILHDAAETFAERHKVYGDNYLLVGNVLNALFPEGIELKTPDDFNRFHLLFLNIVKLTRYVQNWDKGGHADSARDAAVYWAMLESVDDEIKEKEEKVKTTFDETMGREFGSSGAIGKSERRIQNSPASKESKEPADQASPPKLRK